MTKTVDVNHLARLAQMKVTPQEAAKLSQGFSETLKTIADLKELDTSKAGSTFQVTGLKNVFRQDEIDQKRVLTQKQALSNAPKTHQGYFVVPAIFS